MRKYVIAGIVVVVVAIIAAIVVWRVQVSNDNKAWDRATDAFGRADYEAARKDLDKVGEPKTEDRLRIYGQTMYATQDLDRALKAYQDLYALNKDASVQLLIGNIYTDKNQFDDAIKVYRDVIASNPNNTQAYTNLATLYQQQQNPSEAIAVANLAVQNNPGSGVLHELQVSMLLPNNRNTPEFQAAVDSLRAVSPDSPLLTSIEQPQ